MPEERMPEPFDKGPWTQEEVEAYIDSLGWWPETPDLVKDLVSGQIRNFAERVRKSLLSLRDS